MNSNIYFPKVVHTPKIVNLYLDGRNMECISVEISDEEYEVCESTSLGKNFWSNSKTGAYGAGLGRTYGDDFKPARTGLLGQMAFAKLFGEPFDRAYRKGGDRQDNLIGGRYRVDVKCPMKNYGKALVYHTNEWGRRIPLDKDIYVCGFVKSEDRIAKIATIILVGFAFKHEVKKAKVRPGIRGNGHLNYEVPFSELRSIAKFLELKKSRFGVCNKNQCINHLEY